MYRFDFNATGFKDLSRDTGAPCYDQEADRLAKHWSNFSSPGVNSESISSLRHQLFIRSFDSVAGVIETLMPPKDDDAKDNDAKDEYLLSPDARIALHSALTNAHHFAAVILPHFYQHDTLDLLCNNKEHIQLAYSEYGQLLRSPSGSLYPKFSLAWKTIEKEKDIFRHLERNIKEDKPWKRSVIHRVHDNGKDESMCRKRVVLDPINPDRYADTNKFYTMLSKNLYIVGRNPKHRVEYHIFISMDCPLTDAEIKDILADHKGNSY